VLFIPDGVADEPQSSLGDRTPLQAADVPNMDRIAREGVVGRTDNVPASMPSGSDVGTMSLFGYDPLIYHTGRAPLEAAAQGIELGEDDWAIRCNLVTIRDGRMVSFTAGQIPNDVGESLIRNLQHDQCGDSQWKFHVGVSYRNLLIYRARGRQVPFTANTTTTPPHDLTGQEIAVGLPSGPGAELLQSVMDRSCQLFADVPENVRRADQGHEVASQIWLWGLGKRPSLEAFDQRYGVRGAVITAVDLLRGIGRLIGWDVIEVEGATGYLDTDYAAKGHAAIDTLSKTNFVVVHVEATDEASHEGNAAAKVEALERIDGEIVGPVHDWLDRRGEDYRLLVCPDHPTLLRTRTHSHGYCPFAMCGCGISSDEADRYDESIAAESDYVMPAGHRLMGELIEG